MSMVLSLSFLGTFQVLLDDRPASFATDRARALLAFLAVEADRPHRREVLAGMLWPNRPEKVARQNLSQTLVRLRRAIDDYHAEPPFLSITAKAMQFNAPATDLDVAHFEQLMRDCASHNHPSLESCPPCAERLQQAANLYGGEFLEGQFLSDSQAFEEWTLFKRQELHRQALEALHALTRFHEAQGALDRMKQFAERQLALEPWLEEAHRQLMRALALDGQRSEALAQYHSCCRIQAEELGVQPEPETTALFELIRDGEIEPQAPVLVSGGALAGQEPTGGFVGRARELERLDGFLARAMAGQGQLVLITGEAGSGKSALASEFARRAQEQHAELVMARGTCNAQVGLGDPYLPFREVLSQLSGGIEAPWAEGVISGENAARLSALAPVTGAVLAELGPDLIGTFAPGASLPGRVAARGAGGMDGGVSQAPGGAPMPAAQSNLFQQYTAVLRALAGHRPLLLVVHALHRADASSASLLFHLCLHLSRSRILLVATYRPEDVAVGWANGVHPLRDLIGELKREFGDVQVDLDRMTREERRSFVDALLDAEPNALAEDFRQTLFALTEGHALFTVELVRELQECGDLRLDAEGRWVAGPTLNWDRLPVRVEGVIEKRVGRLAPHLRAALRVASVEGEEFTAEAVARVQGIAEPSLIRTLSAQGVRQHRLLAPPSLHWVSSRHLSRYRFRHHLYQRYLYQTLDEAECALLHDEVGRALEALYGAQVEQVAVQMARHFEAAGRLDKAVDYLIRAGERALRLAGPEEALGYFRRGLKLLRSLPESAERAQRERDLLGAVSGWLSEGSATPDLRKARALLEPLA